MEWSITYIFSQVFCIAMYVFLAITYHAKNRKKVLVFNSLALISSFIMYSLLDAWTGQAMSFIAIIRNIVFLIDEKKNGKSDKITKKDTIILIIIAIATILVTIPAYNGFLSLLSVFATTLYSISVWQKKKIAYRFFGIPIGILWISYNIYILNLFGIILESILLIVSTSGYIVELKKIKKETK